MYTQGSLHLRGGLRNKLLYNVSEQSIENRQQSNEHKHINTVA